MVSMEFANKLFVASEILVIGVFGLFGNSNLVCIILSNVKLRSKSGFLQCCVAISHIVCILFELPNSYLLFLGINLHRNTCFPIISIYIFFICAQSVLMLSLVADIFWIIFFPALYQRVEFLHHIIIMLSPAIVYSGFIVGWGFWKMDDEIIPFCNPPIGLHPTVSRFWSLSNVILNSLVLFVFLLLIVSTSLKWKNGSKESRKLVKRLKINVLVYVFSWYIAVMGVDVFVSIGLKGNMLAILQSNMVFFALIAYSNSFYLIIWRSSEYRNGFLNLWRCIPFVKAYKIKNNYGTRITTLRSSFN